MIRILTKLTPALKRIGYASTPMIVGCIVCLLIFLPIILIIIFIPIYEITCSKILLRDIPLSDFGSFFAGITGLLAFWTVVVSLHLSERRADKVEKESRDRFKEDSERNIFFQLLELHTNKVNAVEFNGIKGAEAFKELADIANNNLNILYVTQLVIDKCKHIKKDELIILVKNEPQILVLLNSMYRIYCGSDLYKTTCNYDKIRPMIINLVTLIENKGIQVYNSIYKDNYSVIARYLINYPNTLLMEKNSEYIKVIADFMYEEYGHILGHYFRNMYYVMDTIDSFSDKKNYKELFRAQLSRYELALGLFNAVSSNSSDKMIHLLKEFEVYKDIYPNDITILKVLMNKDDSTDTTQEKMLAITNIILDSWKQV